MNYTSILTEILILFIYVLLGFYVKKKNFVSEAGIQDISKIVVNVAMPLLVISSINIDYKPEYGHNMMVIAIISFFYLLFLTLSSKQLLRFFKSHQGDKNSMRYALLFGNIVFLGFPLCYGLFGDIGVLYASVYVAMQNIFQWTIGVHFFNSGKFEIKDLKKLLNPGLIGITIGMFLFFLNIKTPPMMLRVIKGVGSISIPLSLMMIGATLGDFKLMNIISDKGAQFVSFFKSLGFPIFFLIFLFFMPIDSTLKSVLTIMAAAPVQASAAVIAKSFGGDSVVVAKSVALTTFLCIGTIPLFLMLMG